MDSWMSVASISDEGYSGSLYVPLARLVRNSSGGKITPGDTRMLVFFYEKGI